MFFQQQVLDDILRNLKLCSHYKKNDFYELSKKSSLWGSLMIGIMPKMRHSLDWADSLMLKFYEMVPAHTIEEFSLSETLSKNYKLAEGKNFVSLYSTSRKKAFAREAISRMRQEIEAQATSAFGFNRSA